MSNKTSEKKLASCAAARARRNADPVKLEKHRQYMREYRQKNREKLNAQSSTRYHGNPEKRFKYRLRRIGVKATDELLAHLFQHSGLCDICGKPGDDRWKELAIDHCHTTHTFRGMLCGTCNKGIGMFQDSEDLMNKAIQYLIQHRKQLQGEYVK